MPEQMPVAEIEKERYAVGCEVAKLVAIQTQVRTIMMDFEQRNAEAEGEHEFEEAEHGFVESKRIRERETKTFHRF